MTFHWYGFIVGTAVSLVVWGIDQQYQHSKSQAKIALSAGHLICLLLLLLVGARAWHVVTDWQLYGELTWKIIAVWQGGLSILGALVAGIVGIYWFIPSQKNRVWLFDTLALWLPLGQAVGRIANFVNQELYGLPTSLPWGIFISPANRAFGFESATHFHPLFAYEALGLLVLASSLWYMHRRHHWLDGEGRLSLGYIQGYLWLRFLLDFLRIDRGYEWYGLGFNQWVVLVTGVFTLIWTVKRYGRRQTVLQWIFMISAMAVMVGGTSRVLAMSRAKSIDTNNGGVQDSSHVSGLAMMHYLRAVPDRSVLTIQRGDTTYKVVVVNTDNSRQQGLSNTSSLPEQGMLFVFENSARYLFWMKDMRYPLDFIWLNDGVVVDLHQNVPTPIQGMLDERLPKYAPRVRANMMLETAAGTIETDGWHLGDAVRIISSSP